VKAPRGHVVPTRRPPIREERKKGRKEGAENFPEHQPQALTSRTESPGGTRRLLDRFALAMGRPAKADSDFAIVPLDGALRASVGERRRGVDARWMAGEMAATHPRLLKVDAADCLKLRGIVHRLVPATGSELHLVDLMPGEHFQ
jgi:hypothetical protein